MKFMSLHYWLVVASALCAIVALANQVDEARLLFHEVELTRTSWAVTVLCDAEVDRLTNRICLFNAIRLAPQEDHHVGILLNRSRLAQV
jgi:hypothetical protein